MGNVECDIFIHNGKHETRMGKRRTAKMISLKDIPVIVGLAGSIITGSFYVHDIKRDVAELGTDYRQHVADQQETSLYEKKWQLEKRIKSSPKDEDAARELEIIKGLLEKNKEQQKILRGVK